VKEALGFLMTREIAHQQSFEKALYAIQPNFPPGKQPGMPEFTNVYFNLSQGEGDTRGPWNNDGNFEYVSDLEQQLAVDGGDGRAEVQIDSADAELLERAKARTRSDPQSDPLTGAMLGAGSAADVELGEESPTDASNGRS
jgi:Mn-containing catalase